MKKRLNEKNTQSALMEQHMVKLVIQKEVPNEIKDHPPMRCQRILKPSQSNDDTPRESWGEAKGWMRGRTGGTW